MEDFEHLDYYTLLGVSRSATADEIKRAYRQQMARYHPDRFTSASRQDQNYASRRAQRLNEAYTALSDFATRTTYNRTLAATGRPSSAEGRNASPPRAAGPGVPTPQRDHLADLYDQARAHLDAGRAPQAVATLRELQQLNPFYRDSATLLAQAEAEARATRSTPGSGPRPAVRDRGRRALMVGGLGVLFLAGAGAAGWVLRGQQVGAGSAAAPLATAQQVGGMPSGVSQPDLSTAPPAPTAGSVPPTPRPAEPTAFPTAAPTSPPPPTAVPVTPEPTPTAPPPTPSPASPPIIAEEGTLLYAEDFRRGRGWPGLSGQGWSVGSVAGAYRITALDGAGNIWAYNTAPAGPDFLVAVTVETTGGLGGLLLRFTQGSYLAFFVDPAAGSYRLEQRSGGRVIVLADEPHTAVLTGAQARNRLAARLEGNTLDLRINGQPVAALVLDTPPPTDRYGLIAVARDTEVVALFTDLAIRSVVSSQ